jgi:phage terminase large subunit
MILTKKQTKALDVLEDKQTNELIFGGGAGGAKSVLGCYWQIKNRLKYPGTRGLIGRAILKTLKDTTLNSFFFVAKEQGLKSNYHFVYNAQRNIISFPSTESEILLKDLYTYPSDPNFDELGSLEITDAFIDECNQVSKKAKDITKSRIRYRLDEYGLIPKILGTCNPAKNWVYSDFYKPHTLGTLEPNKKFIQALLSDNPFISEHYKENLLTLDKNSIERLLYGNWEYDGDPASLIPINKIYDCFTNDFAETGQKYLTADIARFGRDKTVIGIWDGYRLIEILTLDKNKVTEAADLIKKLCHKNQIPISNVVIDDDGVGGGVTDILTGCNGFVNNSSPLENQKTNDTENYNNLKSQCYYKLAELINQSKIYIAETEYRDQIVQELEQVKQHNMDKDAKKQILPKDKVKELIGRSPDFSDMIMMRMFFEVGVRFVFSIK